MRKACAWLLLFVILLMPMMGIGENADIAEGVAMWINGEAVYQSQIDSVTAKRNGEHGSAWSGYIG